MKRYILILLLAYISAFANAQSAKSWVQQLDLVDINKIPKNDVVSFWNQQWDADMDYVAIRQAIKKNKKSIQQANDNISKFLLSSYYDRSNLSINERKADSLCLRIEKDLHIEDLRKAFPDINHSRLKFKIVKLNDVNASTYPDGFIMLYDGLFTKLDNYDELLAVCCHELTHFMFKHSLGTEYAYIKKQKTNKLLAEIGSGILIAANTFADGYAASNGVSVSDKSQYYVQMYQGFIEDAAEGADRYRFRYSRKDELQADVIGFRYLQYLGFNGKAYLNMLQKLGTDNDKYYSKKSDHPKMQLRIEVIKTLLDEKG